MAVLSRPFSVSTEPQHDNQLLYRRYYHTSESSVSFCCCVSVRCDEIGEKEETGCFGSRTMVAIASAVVSPEPYKRYV